MFKQAYKSFPLGKKIKKVDIQLDENKEEDNWNKDENKDEDEGKENKRNNFLVNFAEDALNNDFWKVVKDSFKGASKLINSIIGIVPNYDNEMKARQFDTNEFTGRIKIAYRPQNIVAYAEKIDNPDYKQFYDEDKYEFIPGF